MAGEMVDPNDLSRFKQFTIHNTPYKTVHNHAITLDVMYPTALLCNHQATSTPRPVILRFHGGGLVTSSSLYPGFFSRWLLELAQKHNAIIVSPNYQLLPEASPADILSDIKDAWKWTQSSLETYLTTTTTTNGTIKPDLSRIITSGESAGGLLAMLAGLDEAAAIKAVVAQYPMIDLKSAHFTQDYDKSPFGLSSADFPLSLIDDQLKKAVDYKRDTGVKSVVSSDQQLTRFPVMFSTFVHGKFGDLIGNRDGAADMYVFDRMRRGQKFPRGGLFVWHGVDDTVVPVEGSHALQKVVQETDPDLNFKLVLQPGEHGFDSENRLQDKWLTDIVGQVEHAWLS